MTDDPDRDAERRDREEEMSEDLLEQITGGLKNYVNLCDSCGKRIAVYRMNVCASCFRARHPAE